jgi:hypothetical protein
MLTSFRGDRRLLLRIRPVVVVEEEVAAQADAGPLAARVPSLIQPEGAGVPLEDGVRVQVELEQLRLRIPLDGAGAPLPPATRCPISDFARYSDSENRASFWFPDFWMAARMSPAAQF